MEIQATKNILFYAENREGAYGFDDIEPPKYIKYSISTSETTADRFFMGFGGERKFITLSNDKLIVTNDLWYLGPTNDIPEDALIGTLHDSINERLFGNIVECYIYSAKDRKRVVASWNATWNGKHSLHLS